MLTEVEQRRKLYRLVSGLSGENIEKVASYAAFLRYIQDREDAEDLRIIEERTYEPTVPWEAVKRELNL